MKNGFLGHFFQQQQQQEINDDYLVFLEYIFLQPKWNGRKKSVITDFKEKRFEHDSLIENMQTFLEFVKYTYNLLLNGTTEVLRHSYVFHLYRILYNEKEICLTSTYIDHLFFWSCELFYSIFVEVFPCLHQYNVRSSLSCRLYQRIGYPHFIHFWKW